MSAGGAKLTLMDLSLVVLALGALILGLVIGLIIGQKLKGSTGDDSQSREKLAVAQNTIEHLSAQLTEKSEALSLAQKREADLLAQENKILQELAPVKENIGKMEAKVAEIERERNTQFDTIKTQLEAAQEQNKILASNTNALQSALSNNQARGKWGEVSLRNLLESAGMMVHVDFIEQTNLTNDEGVAIKPDCIIKYPGNKFVPVDSKFPYADFERAIKIPEVASPDDERERKKHMKAHVDAVKKHINEISAKSYYSALDAVKGLESAPEFTILFVANDGILAATVAEDPTVLEYAFKNQVALVSPNSLFGVLRTIQHIWRAASQEETMHEIIRVGKEIHSRLRVVAEHASKVGSQLDGAVKAYNKLVSSMERNLLTSTRDLNKKSMNLLDDNKPLIPLEELSESTDSFTKPELTESPDAIE
jgi:DNA recombination protein RmuC